MAFPSPSSRRAWIEIVGATKTAASETVALLAEGVDRNMNKTTRCMPVYSVALLAEGVDRNADGLALFELVCVALLAEGVDRNSKGEGWHCMTAVALLAEGVDRNADMIATHYDER